ncbi:MULTISPECIES: HNH endonuclease [Caballeronia]|nr:HNH endonuclease [Caballeronia sp. GaOx3]
MTSSIARYRARAFKRQSGLCFYCGCPMWDRCADPFIDRYRLSRRQALQLQCTAEHLHAQIDGGENCPQNIVAACRTCNARRHYRKAIRNSNEHRAHVQRCVSRGKWHAKWVFDYLALTTVCQQAAEAKTPTA